MDSQPLLNELIEQFEAQGAQITQELAPLLAQLSGVLATRLLDPENKEHDIMLKALRSSIMSSLNIQQIQSQRAFVAAVNKTLNVLASKALESIL